MKRPTLSRIGFLFRVLLGLLATFLVGELDAANEEELPARPAWTDHLPPGFRPGLPGRPPMGRRALS